MLTREDRIDEPLDKSGSATRRGRSASDTLFYGVLESLEQQKVVPGQRLIESDLCKEYRIGRNSAREGLQRLQAIGIVELSPHKGASIRKLSLQEAAGWLDVAEMMTGLAARLAARNINTSPDAELLRNALAELRTFQDSNDEAGFSRARRHFYRAMLRVAGNPELARLLAMLQVHIVHFQYHSERLRALRRIDYPLICEKIFSGDEDAAEGAGRQHVRNVREAVLALHEGIHA